MLLQIYAVKHLNMPQTNIDIVITVGWRAVTGVSGD